MSPSRVLNNLLAESSHICVTSVFWPTRGSILHVRRGLDIVWDEQSDWVRFCGHLQGMRSEIEELGSMHQMVVAFPTGTKLM